MKPQDTSWNQVAGWYDQHLSGEADTYQQTVILPNLSRLLAPKKGEIILDLACGNGFFSRALATTGAKIIGVDAASNLINLAKKNSSPEISYHVGNADELTMIKSGTIDKVLIVLALQNIEKVKEVFNEVKRVLKREGKIFMVLNHPAFRIPKQSAWGWSEENKIQYRRLDQYLSESQAEIEMNPGAGEREAKVKTVSFHRPLQYYLKLLAKAGFAVTRLEEWISPKLSQAGPRAAAENRARQEFPLFLFLEAVVYN